MARPGGSPPLLAALPATAGAQHASGGGGAVGEQRGLRRMPCHSFAGLATGPARSFCDQWLGRTADAHAPRARSVGARSGSAGGLRACRAQAPARSSSSAPSCSPARLGCVGRLVARLRGQGAAARASAGLGAPEDLVARSSERSTVAAAAQPTVAAETRCGTCRPPPWCAASAASAHAGEAAGASGATDRVWRARVPRSARALLRRA